MKRSPSFPRLALAALAALALTPSLGQAEAKHAIAMYGEAVLPPDFAAFPYANPNAPVGGRIVVGEVGSFDSLNPYIRKGSVPWQLRFLTAETLMARNWDEPFSLYGLLAESVETDPDRTWVEFTLNPAARFSDGNPVTLEDVLWSFETLGTIGHPRYAGAWSKVETMEAVGERTVRFTFNSVDRELPLILGLRPVLQKAQFEGVDFAEAGGLDIIPVTSGPYVIDDFQAGRYVSLKRNPDYWGWDEPARAGHANLDEIRMEFYTDATAQFEAFKAGEMNFNREFDAQKWQEQYDFASVQSGDVIKAEIAHGRPTGITGYVMNTRRAPFDDWRVRDALIHAFPFEFINDTMNGGTSPRISSYFSNSLFAMSDGPAEGKVKDLLEPFADSLYPGALEGYALPVSDGSARNRAGIAAALDKLAEAGWEVVDGKLSKDGAQMAFEILVQNGPFEQQAITEVYVESLKRLGIDVTAVSVDKPQFTERTNVYDFDMTFYRRALSLSPGNEQMSYWGPEGVTEPGTRNWMGMDSPAAVAMIDAILNAPSRDGFISAVKALDRVLTTGRYVVPIYSFEASRIAYAKDLAYPETIPIYGDWIDWQPMVWWSNGE